MPSVRLEGVVKAITPLEEKANFKKRDLIIKTEETYPQVISIEFTKDKESELDFVEIGENVIIDANIRGREWKNERGENKYFLSLQAWKIEKKKS